MEVARWADVPSPRGRHSVALACVGLPIRVGVARCSHAFEGEVVAVWAHPMLWLASHTHVIPSLLIAVRGKAVRLPPFRFGIVKC